MRDAADICDQKQDAYAAMNGRPEDESSFETNLARKHLPIFKNPEPDILVQYYDKGEGLWQWIKRHIQNIPRRLRGNALLDCDERDFEFDACEEQMWFGDR